MERLTITYNGHLLDDLVPGYTTANIEGRGFPGANIQAVTPEGRDGAILLSYGVNDLHITVRFVLQRNNHAERMESMDTLLRLLHTREVCPFSFSDEAGTRYGILESVENLPYDYFSGQGAFTIYCKDPWVYGPAKNFTGTIGELSVYGAIPDEITFAPTADTDKVVIKNATTGRKIVINHDVTAGQEVKVRIPANRVTVNGKNATQSLDYMTSDFHSFVVFEGDEITATPAGTLSLKVRDRWL